MAPKNPTPALQLLQQKFLNSKREVTKKKYSLFGTTVEPNIIDKPEPYTDRGWFAASSDHTIIIS